MKDEWKIVLLAIICFILGTSEYVIVGVLDKIANSSHISIAQAGQLISVFALTVSLGTPLMVHYVSKWNQRKVMMMALMMVILGSVMMIISSTYVLFLLSRVIMALGVGVFNVICFLAATKLAAPERRGRAVSTVTLGFNAALIVGLPIGRIVTNLFGWQAIFIFTASLSCFSILAIYKFIPPIKDEASDSFWEELKLLKKPVIILSLLTSFFWILGYSHLYTYITPYLQHTSFMGERMLSITFLIFGIATLIGNRVGGILGDRFGVNKVIVFSLLGNVCLLVLLSIFSYSSYASIAILVCWGMAAWMPGPLFRYNAIALAPSSQAVILSLYNSVIQFGMATGSGEGGIEIEHSSAHLLSWTSAGAIIIALGFALMFVKYFTPEMNGRKNIGKRELVGQ